MWQNHLFSQPTIPPFFLLEKLFGLSRWNAWPNAAGLNQLAENMSADVPKFVCQSDVEGESDYYEQIIYKQGRVPTRADNWHDLFNGLIWLMFPRTKALLNQQHIEDINRFGLSPRTKRRNHITHFDECGVVLVSQKDTVQQLLAEHQWQQAFWHHRMEWQQHIQVWVFGHANLEMLVNPFMGLTGKWIPVYVESDYFLLDKHAQLTVIDDRLYEKIQNGLFSENRPLKPLPLLGVPGWTPENEDVSYYENTDYFRPKRIR